MSLITIQGDKFVSFWTERSEPALVFTYEGNYFLALRSYKNPPGNGGLITLDEGIEQGHVLLEDESYMRHVADENEGISISQIVELTRLAEEEVQNILNTSS